jgi:hypothetical protein
METFTIHMVPDDNTKFPANYFRYVMYDKTSDSYYQITRDENKEYDKEIWKEDYSPTMITGNRIESNIGDTIYVVFRYNKERPMLDELEFIYAYKNDQAVKAIVRALKDYDSDKRNEKLYKVCQLTITKDMIIEKPSKDAGKRFDVLELFNQDDPILIIYKNEEEGQGVEINPEYAKNQEVKNAMLSMKTISKFKL